MGYLPLSSFSTEEEADEAEGVGVVAFTGVGVVAFTGAGVVAFTGVEAVAVVLVATGAVVVLVPKDGVVVLVAGEGVVVVGVVALVAVEEEGGVEVVVGLFTAEGVGVVAFGYRYRYR